MKLRKQNHAANLLLAMLGTLVLVCTPTLCGGTAADQSIIEKASALVGVTLSSQSKDVKIATTIVDDSTTPFLQKNYGGKKAWQITFVEPQLALAAGKAPEECGNIEALVDSSSGRLLRVTWNLSPIDTALDVEVSASNAESSMDRNGESYTGIPDTVPQITFIDAVLACPYPAVKARQIVGQYVYWKSGDSADRPIWAITLRGIPPIEPHGAPGYSPEKDSIPEYQRNRIRCIVSIPSGDCIRAGTMPSIPLKPEDRKRILGE